MYFFFQYNRYITNYYTISCYIKFTVIFCPVVHIYGLFHAEIVLYFLNCITIVIVCLHFRMLAVAHGVARAVPPGYKIEDSPSLQILRR